MESSRHVLILCRWDNQKSVPFQIIKEFSKRFTIIEINTSAYITKQNKHTAKHITSSLFLKGTFYSVKRDSPDDY